MLPGVDLVGVDWALGEVQDRRLPRRDELVDFLHGSRLGHTSVRTEFGPEHTNEDVTALDQ